MRGSSFTGDIAIDDFSFSLGCAEQGKRSYLSVVDCTAVRLHYLFDNKY